MSPVCPTSIEPRSLVPSALADRHTVCGREKEWERERKRFKITDRRSGTVISQREARARRQHDLDPAAVNPEGCTLPRSQWIKVSTVDPRVEEYLVGEKRRRRCCVRKARPPVGEKRERGKEECERVYRSRLDRLKRELRYFRRICGEACITKQNARRTASQFGQLASRHPLRQQRKTFVIVSVLMKLL